MLTQPHFLVFCVFKIYHFLAHESKYESSALQKKPQTQKQNLIAQFLLCNIYCSSGDFTNLEMLFKSHKYTTYSGLHPVVNYMRKEHRFGVLDIYTNSEGGKWAAMRQKSLSTAP